MSAADRQAGIVEANRARVELYDTLGQLRDRLDYAQRIDDRIAETKLRIAEERQENPGGFAIGVAVAATAVGLAAWGIAALVRRALK